MSSIQSQSPAIAVCILGMHRSGTSALARLINLLGVDLGEDLIPGSRDNPKGFWEHREILKTHEDILDSLSSSFDDFFPLPDNWKDLPQIEPFRKRLIDILKTQFANSKMWGFKDPRTCRLLSIWHDIFSTVGAESRFVVLIRSPEEIARSLTARDGYAFNKSLLLTMMHLIQAEIGTRGRPRVVVSFDRLLKDWKSEIAKIQNTLGIAWPRSPEQIESQVSEFLDPALRHHAINTPVCDSVAARDADANAVRWMSQLHEMFLAAQDDPAKIDSALVDRILAEFQADRPRLINWRAHRSLERGYMILQDWGTNLDRKFHNLRDENNWLKLAMVDVGIDPVGAVAAMKAQCDAYDPAHAPARLVADNSPSLQLLADHAAAAARILHLQETIDRLNFEAEGLRGNAALQKEKLDWLDIHVPRLEAEIARLNQAHSWLLKQNQILVTEMSARDKELEKLRAWVAQLERGRAHFIEEIAVHAAEYEKMQKWIAELESAKNWLADQRKNLLAELQKHTQSVPDDRKAP